MFLVRNWAFMQLNLSWYKTGILSQDHTGRKTLTTPKVILNLMMETLKNYTLMGGTNLCSQYSWAPPGYLIFYVWTSPAQEDIGTLWDQIRFHRLRQSLPFPLDWNGSVTGRVWERNWRLHAAIQADAILGDPGAVSRVGRKDAGRKFSSTGEKAPGYRLLPNYFQKFKQMPAPDWAQKMLCIIVPNRRTVSTEFFLWVRTPRLLFRSRLVWLMHQRNARSQSCSLI